MQHCAVPVSGFVYEFLKKGQLTSTYTIFNIEHEQLKDTSKNRGNYEIFRYIAKWEERQTNRCDEHFSTMLEVISKNNKRKNNINKFRFHAYSN